MTMDVSCLFDHQKFYKDKHIFLIKIETESSAHYCYVLYNFTQSVGY